jgi:hypothetical protein
MWMIFGSGAGVGRSAEVWRFNLKTFKWTLETCFGEIPEGREGHTANYMGNGKVILFGGQGVPYSNEGKSEKITETLKIKTYFVREVYNNLYEFDCNTFTWRSFTVEGASIPLGRRGHISTICSISSKHLINEEAGKYTRTAYSSHRGSSSPTARRNGNDNGKHHGRPHSNSESMEKVFLIFGGAGVESSKYTEVLYSDVWAYCFSRGRWYKLNPKGITPQPICCHKAELIGEHTLVVVGGMVGMEPHYRHLSYESTSDIMILNTHSMQWSYLNLMYPNMRPAKLSVHGHSVVARWQDGSNTAGILYIFGGKEVPDIRGGTIQHYDSVSRRANTNQQRLKPYGWMVDLHTGIVTPLETVGKLLPDNRYGHIGACAYASELQAHDPIKLEDPTNAAAVPKPHHKSVMDRLKANAIREFDNYEEPVMYLYGGCYVANGGYCGHTVYQLIRTHRYHSVDPLENNRVQSPAQSVKQQSNARSGKIKEKHLPHGLGLLMSDKLDYEPPSTAQSEASTKLTMWERRAAQIRKDQTNFGSNCSDESKLLRPPQSWDELKFAISYPLHERDGDVGLGFDNFSVHSGSSSMKSVKSLGTSASAPSVGISPRRLNPIKAAAQCGDSSGEEEKGDSQADAALKREMRLKSMSASLLPMLKHDHKPLYQTKADFLKKFPAQFGFEEFDVGNNSSSLSPASKNSLGSHVGRMN